MSDIAEVKQPAAPQLVCPEHGTTECPHAGSDTTTVGDADASPLAADVGLLERIEAADLFLMSSIQSAWPAARDALTWRALGALRGDPAAIAEYRSARTSEAPSGVAGG